MDDTLKAWELKDLLKYVPDDFDIVVCIEKGRLIMKQSATVCVHKEENKTFTIYSRS